MRLYTPRLCLRPFTLADAPRVRELAGDKRIAETTATIPHPYPEGAAEQWIATLEPFTTIPRDSVFAITLAGTRTPGREHDPTDTGHLVGCVGLRQSQDAQHERAELGYWIGVPYWSRGFATEAGRSVLAYAFSKMNLHRVIASHFTDNPASGRVMQKLGMTCEGILREHFHKDGTFHDVAAYAILHGEWVRQRKPSRPRTLESALQPA